MLVPYGANFRPKGRLIRPSTLFFLILMKLGMWVEVDDWCTMVHFFHNQSQGQGHVGPKVHGGPEVLRYGSTPEG